MPMREGLAVGMQSEVVIHAGGEVAEVCGRKHLARGRLEVHDIDGLLRIGEARRALLRMGDQRACCKEAQETAAEGMVHGTLC